ncbi:MAG: hypothetical protein RR060_07885, partial [Victivallaceae bacterium]
AFSNIFKSLTLKTGNISLFSKKSSLLTASQNQKTPEKNSGSSNHHYLGHRNERRFLLLDYVT